MKDNLDWQLDEDPGKPMKSSPNGSMLRMALGALGACVVVALAIGYFTGGQTRRVAAVPPPPRLAATAPAAAKTPAARSPNTLTYQADPSGHYFVDAVVNGVPMRFLVDTGATLVALSPNDARALGIERDRLDFSDSVNTANGEARVAHTELREVRLGQFSVDDVSAVVMDQPIGVSLLGMSFLSRVSGYSIRDGVLTIEW